MYMLCYSGRFKNIYFIGLLIFVRALPIIWNLKKCLRQPGIKPGTTAWKAAMLTITPLTLHAITDEVTSSLGIPVSTRSGIKLGNICGTLMLYWTVDICTAYNLEFKKMSASTGNRTRNNSLEGCYANHYTIDASH